MKFEIGDRVRFLTETGGGIVVKVKTGTVVVVRTDDDFDIPYHVKDLVKIEDRGSVSEFFTLPEDKKKQEKTKNVALEIQQESSSRKDNEDERYSKIVRYGNRQPLPEGVYLAWVPQDQKLLVSGYVDLYLINDTHFDVLFSIFLHHKEHYFSGTDYDAVPSHEKLLLASFDRDKLEKWSHGIVQMLFHTNKSASVMAPVSSSFKTAPSRFYKEDNYMEYNFLVPRGFILELCKLSDLKPLLRREEKGSYIEEKSAGTTTAQQPIPESFITKHLVSPYEAIVDLHIGSLTDSYRKMADHEILNFQIRYFQRAMESALSNKIHKVTFIHGIGQGILKKQLLDLLEEYKNISIQDAPVRQFGMGAMEVVFH